LKSGPFADAMQLKGTLAGVYLAVLCVFLLLHREEIRIDAFLITVVGILAFITYILIALLGPSTSCDFIPLTYPEASYWPKMVWRITSLNLVWPTVMAALIGIVLTVLAIFVPYQKPKFNSVDVN
jgi:hypothetical protein